MTGMHSNSKQAEFKSELESGATRFAILCGAPFKRFLRKR